MLLPVTKNARDRLKESTTIFEQQIQKKPLHAVQVKTLPHWALEELQVRKDTYVDQSGRTNDHGHVCTCAFHDMASRVSNELSS